MTINISELKACLNKAFRLISPLRKDLDQFKGNLTRLLSLIDEKESEENVKIHLMDFLKNTFFGYRIFDCNQRQNRFCYSSWKRCYHAIRSII